MKTSSYEGFSMAMVNNQRVILGGSEYLLDVKPTSIDEKMSARQR
jgi:hypothetical protein